MTERLADKFDLESLRKVQEQLHDIQIWSISQQENQHLFDVIDGLCRVANMYNQVISQEIEDKHITTGDPQHYINNKLDYPYAVYKKYSKEKTY
ncbi:hypothetical protein WKH57_01645 [Niallia taxi]|uniref:hypothetical protein n=1 Tax=Niallia taxi TaxID=2499688 RepID=UPI00317F59C0